MKIMFSRPNDPVKILNIGHVQMKTNVLLENSVKYLPVTGQIINHTQGVLMFFDFTADICFFVTCFKAVQCSGVGHL